MMKQKCVLKTMYEINLNFFSTLLLYILDTVKTKHTLRQKKNFITKKKDFFQKISQKSFFF